ncbi:Carboxypeptidase [Rhynchospora pubera]|uniref:Carboxypeptidase n=1 Tax=Rhynchospora pubera TaxID=906938 RepID=A0AAV8EPQ3_9POAL|nr:Carboxypeptidase [Rhynchospora pubera]
MALFHLLAFSFLLFSSILASSPSSIYPEFARPTKSGYLPMKSDPTSALFYAFYEAQEPVSSLPDTPLLLWLEGGPGCSSMLGNFFHFGPWLLSPKDNFTLYQNPFTWNLRFGLLFIDSPLGTGYSIVKNASEIPHDQFTIASHLLVALQAFLSLNSSFRSRPLYIAGESYGGKFVPSLGYHILRQNKHVLSNLRINLKGIAIGNGLTHPVTQVATHADSVYYTGLINEEQKGHLESRQLAVVKLIIAHKWKEASDVRTVLLKELKNATGVATLFDFTRKTDYPIEMISEFLNQGEVMEVLGVSKDVHFQLISDDVAKALHEDKMKSVKYMVEELVQHIQVLLYQGVYDLQDGVVSNEAWLREMHWGCLEGFLKAGRKVWKDNGVLIGYVQHFASLSEVVLHGAGHFAVHDQKSNAQKMIEHWIMEKGLFYDGDENFCMEKGSFYDGEENFCMGMDEK